MTIRASGRGNPVNGDGNKKPRHGAGAIREEWRFAKSTGAEYGSYCASSSLPEKIHLLGQEAESLDRLRWRAERASLSGIADGTRSAVIKILLTIMHLTQIDELRYSP